MRSVFVFSLVCFSLTLGIALGNPARPLYEPEAAPKQPTSSVLSVNLNGTAWLGKYNSINRIFVFDADGTLGYKSATAAAAKTGKVFKGRGAWRLQGDVLTFEHFITPNNIIMQFRGKLIDANTIVGEVTYPQLGKKDQQTMKRSAIEAK